MYKPFILAGLALGLSACGHGAPVAPVTQAATGVAALVHDPALDKLITSHLIPPGEEVRMAVTDIKVSRIKLGYAFTCTRTETTRYAERDFYAVTGTITGDDVTWKETFVKSEKLGG